MVCSSIWSYCNFSTLADNFELQISPGSSRTKLNQLTGRHHFNECANLFEPEYVESHVQYVKELHPLNSLKIATFRLVDDELQTLRQFFELSWNCCHHLLYNWVKTRFW